VSDRDAGFHRYPRFPQIDRLTDAAQFVVQRRNQVDDAPQPTDRLHALLLKLLIEHPCGDEDEIDSGGDPLTVEIMYLCAEAELMKIEAFGQMITGRLTSDAVDLVLDNYDDPDLIDAACRLEAIEPMLMRCKPIFRPFPNAA
jgi:hypothetical protein